MTILRLMVLAGTIMPEIVWSIICWLRPTGETARLL
jgi:hypothetical protein